MAKSDSSLLIEAELFDDLGGWSIDSQFAPQMGSAYLIAHGMGEPVADAHTTVTIPQTALYAVWVRAKDWVPDYHPGRFELSFDGSGFSTVLGQNGKDWNWEKVGDVELSQGKTKITLHDLTGFDGRIDALFLSCDGSVPPEEGLNANRSWRARMLGTDAPVDEGHFDLVIVGGGFPACVTALSAARSGLKVALVSDRPVLGGNASSEVGLGPRGYISPLVEQLREREPDGDLKGCELAQAEPNVSVFENLHMHAATTAGRKITSIEAYSTLDYSEHRFTADMFVDASGVGALARAAGCEIRTGREGKDEFGESLAPDKPDGLHHGNTLLFHLGMADHPVVYGDIPWATEISKDFSCLSGQMGGLSQDNQPGPCAVEPAPEQMKELAEEAKTKLMQGIKEHHMFPPEEVMHLFPASHYWEYGQYLDMDEPGNEEYVRDYLLRALYGTMANIKKAQPEKYANLCFEWIHLTPARGEYVRIMGDYIVTENDIREHRHFDDCAALNDEAFCVHIPRDEKYDFRLAKWIWDVRDMKPYEIPFRSLYAKDIDNLMMVGKHISVSRVASTSVKMMANGANHGIAVGIAAALCKQYGMTPRELDKAHVDELWQKVQDASEKTL
jgi:hypothetical protein